MILCIPDILTTIQTARARAMLDEAGWMDGRAITGVYHNLLRQWAEM